MDSRTRLRKPTYILNLAEVTEFSLRIFGLNFLVVLRRESLLSLSANQKSRLKSAGDNPAPSTKMSIDSGYRSVLNCNKYMYMS